MKTLLRVVGLTTALGVAGYVYRNELKALALKALGAIPEPLLEDDFEDDDDLAAYVANRKARDPEFAAAYEKAEEHAVKMKEYVDEG